MLRVSLTATRPPTARPPEHSATQPLATTGPPDHLSNSPPDRPDRQLGMCFFANRMMFDDNGYRVYPSDPCHLAKFHDPENPCAEVPRANFDTFVWGFTTVFEVLSGENWNAVYYDTVS